jgi:hypothetical protein
MNKHRSSRRSGRAPGNQQVVNDETLGSDLRNAIAGRVDATLDLGPLPFTAQATVPHTTNSNSTASSISNSVHGAPIGVTSSPLATLRPLAPGTVTHQTPQWNPNHLDTTFVGDQKVRTNRRKKIGLSLLAVAGLTAPLFALTRPTLFASKRTDTQIVQVASTENDRFPVKLIARDPGYKVKMFYSSLFGPGGPPLQSGLHLWDGSVWIDVRPERTEISGLPTVGVKLVVIGGVAAQIIEDKSAGFSTIRWKVDGQAVVGYANLFGPDQADALSALGQIRLVENTLVFEKGPSRFSAVALEDEPNQYGVNVSEVKDHTVSLHYSVGTAPSYARDYLVGDQPVKRGNRLYYLLSVSEGYTQVSFRFGQAEVFVSGQVTQDRLLAFADTLTEATPEEWEEIVAKKFSNELSEEIRTDNLLIDGQLDEDDPASAEFEFIAPLVKDAEKAECVKVIFSVKVQNKTSCIDRNSAEQFRLLESVTVDGVTVVYGVDAPDERDNHVVRVTDAAGDVVAEDVTLDQRNFSGRAFALALPTDSVAPFTVELFDFDREWYSAGEDLPDTYVRPDSTPIASAKLVP